MTERKPIRYIATYTHDERAWIVQFRDPDIATFGRTLAAAKRYARSALAVHLEVEDLEAAGIEVVDNMRIPDEVAEEVVRLVKERTRVDALRTDLARSTRRTAAGLRRLGFSTRDVGRDPGHLRVARCTDGPGEWIALIAKLRGHRPLTSPSRSISVTVRSSSAISAGWWFGFDRNALTRLR